MITDKAPVFIWCRDRYGSLLKLIEWLEHADAVDRIVLFDCETAYPPLLDYFATTQHQVVKLPNFGQREFATAREMSAQWGYAHHVVSDPDLLPRDDCPRDIVPRMIEALDETGFKKAGPSLEIGDLPEQYTCRLLAIEAEIGYWLRPISPRYYAAQIDSTFGMQRTFAPDSGFQLPAGDAIRLNYPYVMRHSTWYLDLAHPENWPEDERFYHERAVHKGWYVNWPLRAVEWVPGEHFSPKQITAALGMLRRLCEHWTEPERLMCESVCVRVERGLIMNGGF